MGFVPVHHLWLSKAMFALKKRTSLACVLLQGIAIQVLTVFITERAAITGVNACEAMWEMG